MWIVNHFSLLQSDSFIQVFHLSSSCRYQFLVLVFCNMHCSLKRLFLLHYTFSKLYILCKLSFLVTFKAIFQEKRHVGIQIQFVWDVNDLGKLVLLKYIFSHLLFFTDSSLYLCLLLKYYGVIHVDHTEFSGEWDFFPITTSAAQWELGCVCISSSRLPIKCY